MSQSHAVHDEPHVRQLSASTDRSVQQQQQPEATSSLPLPVCVITGANSGIGLEAARLLAGPEQGPQHVIFACRDGEAAQRAMAIVRADLPGACVTFLPLDLASLPSVRQFAHDLRVFLDGRPLHGLVLNAGHADFYGKPATTEQGFEKHFAINYLGHFLLVHLLMDCLMKDGSPRIVAVSSSLHDKPTRGRRPHMDFEDLQLLEKPDTYTGRLAYGNSKLAMILFVYELDRRMRARGIDHVLANAVSPGFIPFTGLFRHANVIVRTGLSCIGTMARFYYPDVIRTAEEGGLCVALAVTSHEAQDAPKYFKLSTEDNRLVAVSSADETYNEGIARQLYDVSCKLVGIEPL